MNVLFFLSPWFFVFFTFSLFPIAYSFYLSFTKFRATSTKAPKFIGIDNYTKLISDDRFLNAIKNSLYFLLGTTPIILFIALILAFLLNQRLRLKNFYRISYFLPVLASLFVIATLFIELYALDGFFNQLLAVFQIKPIHWLRDTTWALPSIMMMNIWSSFGFYTLILIAGMQNIPDEYYEAAKIDGASKIRQFFTITLPLLKPTIIVVLIINSILAFQVFGEIFIMTKGGPLRSTETAVYYLYNIAFSKQKMGWLLLLLT